MFVRLNERLVTAGISRVIHKTVVSLTKSIGVYSAEHFLSG